MRDLRSPLWLLLALLAAAVAPVAAQNESECYAVIAGRACSADGAVLFAHNEDDGGARVLQHWKIERRRHRPGEVVRLLGGAELARAPQTWACLWSQLPGYRYSDAYLNEHGVALASDSCPSREDAPELVRGGIGFMLRRLVALRARSAREGIDLAITLLGRFGYAASGRTLIIADPREAWVLCMVQGKHWVGARVPDDKAMVIANSYPIHAVDTEDGENWRLSPGLIDYAVKRGWYDPERDGAFDFARAYARPGARLDVRNYRRQWRGICMISDDPVEEGWKLPAFVTPRKKLTPPDLMAVLRDHYEGTAHDLSAAYTKGSPHRMKQRCICTGTTQNGVVFQLRSNLPPEVGALMWVALRRPDASVFLPWYAGMRRVPAGFASGDPGAALANHFEPASRAGDPPPGFAVFAAVSRLLDEDYGARFPLVKEARDKLETSFLQRQKTAEGAAARFLENDREAGLDFLTDYVRAQSERAVTLYHGLEKALRGKS